MIDFDINIEEKTPYLDLLESLTQQSHALKTIHNPKTWCLSALTYALHLNDCLVLFQNLKERWSKELPFSEAWDVSFTHWKSEIWSAVNDIQCSTDNGWKSLCDIDYQHFIELSNQVADGEITITPLISFVEGKESSIAKIIKDVGRKLCEIFKNIESMIYRSEPELYLSFYESCIEAYKERHKDNLYVINTKSINQTYETWISSKSEKKRIAGIKKLMDTIIKEFLDYKTWKDLWEENYENEELDPESIARYIFANRHDLISSKQPTYQNSFDKLFYVVIILEFLKEQLALLTRDNNITSDLKEEDYKRTNSILKTRINDKQIAFQKIADFLKQHAVDHITFKYEWFAIYLFLFNNNLLEDKQYNLFAEQMNKSEWFGYLTERKKCSADSMGEYSFMLNYPEARWVPDIIPTNSKATAKGLRTIIRMYDELKLEYNQNSVLAQ